MTNVTLNTATRKCTADKYFLGYEGENNINKLIFKFEDGFRDGLGILNVKREEEKGYLDLKKVGDTYELEVKSALLSKIGEITFQFTVNEPNGTVIKYDAFQMVVKDSIDADTEMPEDYPNWIDMANAKLAEVDEAIEKTEKATANAEEVANNILQAKVNGEFNGKDGKDGVDGANGISSEITVKTNTETEYVLTVKDVNGSFDTPNLKGKDSEGGIVNETDPIYLADKPSLALKTEIPTKTSELANDSSFATENFVTNKIAEAELSGGDVDLSGYATKDELNKKADVEDIPTKLSELDNDSGFITDYNETDPTVPNHVKAITEADITNWNNKQDVLTAGNNITIENGVISASGSGEGGLAELPIATADVLGGIKVGEGLEITEDGILSALGGGNAGNQKVLWEGEVSTANEVLTLSESIENFDYIYVENGFIPSGSTNRRYSTPLIALVDTLKANGYGEIDAYYGGTWNTGTTTSSSNTMMGFYFTSATTLKIKDAYTSGNNLVPTVYKVVGIKLGSGGGSGNRTEIELLNAPAKYQQGTTTTKTIGQDLSLLDDITKYDEIVILCSGDTGAGNIGHPCEVRFLTSNIVFNNSNDQLWNGSRFTIYTLADVHRYLGGWFKNGNTFRVQNTFASSTSALGYFVIQSIKGIKY